MLPDAASVNSAASQYQMLCGNGEEGFFTFAITMSMMVFATQKVATGTSAVRTRAASSPPTTAGPDLHSSFSTGGILRRAAARSRQFFLVSG